MSIGFLLGSPDDAVIWRGPKKNGESKNIIQIFCIIILFKQKISHNYIIFIIGTKIVIYNNIKKTKYLTDICYFRYDQAIPK